MNTNKGLTRVEVIIAAACVALVLVHAGIINAGGRERSKREVCLANLRMLTAAWKMYADDNGGKVVNGGQSRGNTINPVREPYWCTPLPPLAATDEVGTFPTVRFDWDITGPGALPYAERVSLLKRGALYRYCPDVTIFRCPEADKNMHRSYIMPCSMNGICEACGSAYQPSLVVKQIGQIARTNERIVFLEEKILTPDAFQFDYSPGAPRWGYDYPSITHGDGANFGFADGHAEFRKWTSKKLIDWIRAGWPIPGPTYNNTREDLLWMHNAIWGN